MIEKVRRAALDHYQDADIIDIITLEEFYQYQQASENPYKFSFKNHTLKLSKTFKVAMRANYACAHCKHIAQFIVIHKDSTNPVKHPDLAYASAWIINDENHAYSLTKDHVIPKCAGGRDSHQNLQCLCYLCNQIKDCDVDPSLINSEKPNMIMVDASVFDSHTNKVRDFSWTRKRIKRLHKHMPWYYKILGVDKFLERELKKPLTNKGYYSEES